MHSCKHVHATYLLRTHAFACARLGETRKKNLAKQMLCQGRIIIHYPRCHPVLRSLINVLYDLPYAL